MSIHVLLLELSLQESFSLHFISQEPSSFFSFRHLPFLYYYFTTLSLFLSPLKKFPWSEFRILIIVWLLMSLLLLLYSLYAVFKGERERNANCTCVECCYMFTAYTGSNLLMKKRKYCTLLCYVLQFF